MRREGDFFFFLRLTTRILNFKVLYKGNNAFMSFSLYLFCLSLVNGLWCNVAVGHRGSGLFWTCRLSFGLLCYSLSAHESISSTEISFNLGVQKGCAARGALGGSTLRLFFFLLSCRTEGRGVSAPRRSSATRVQRQRSRCRKGAKWYTLCQGWSSDYHHHRFWTAGVWHMEAGSVPIRG